MVGGHGGGIRGKKYKGEEEQKHIRSRGEKGRANIGTQEGAIERRMVREGKEGRERQGWGA